jgi:hypothetical protein
MNSVDSNGKEGGYTDLDIKNLNFTVINNNNNKKGGAGAAAVTDTATYAMNNKDGPSSVIEAGSPPIIGKDGEKR